MFFIVDNEIVEDDVFADAVESAYDQLSEVDRARVDKLVERLAVLPNLGEKGARKLLARIGVVLEQRPDIDCHFEGGQFVGFTSSEEHPAGLNRIPPNDEIPVPFWVG